MLTGVCHYMCVCDLQVWYMGGDASRYPQFQEVTDKALMSRMDLVVCLGGDGTVLWATSDFQGSVAPLLPVAMGMPRCASPSLAASLPPL